MLARSVSSFPNLRRMGLLIWVSQNFYYWKRSLWWSFLRTIDGSRVTNIQAKMIPLSWSSCVSHSKRPFLRAHVRLHRVWSAHRLLRWHYTRRMRKNAEKSVELRKKKQKILEDVMDTETYKVAKEILDKYGDKTAQKVEVLRAPGPSPYGSGQRPPQPQPVQQAPGLELRQRHPESAKFIPARTNAATVPSQPPSAPNNLANNTASTRMPQQAQQPVQRLVLTCFSVSFFSGSMVWSRWCKLNWNHSFSV